jgi:hypothetical protein
MRTMRSFRTAALAVAALALTASAAFAAVALHDVTGTWALEVVTENGTGTPTLKLKQEGNTLTGTYESRMMGVRALKGTVKGDSLMFDLATSGESTVVLSFLGVIVDADHIKGAVDFAGQGGATFSGTRQK